MFPHVPLQAITLDLADTHSVSLTVDRILSNSIYIPGEGGMAVAGHAPNTDQQGGGDQDGENTPPPQLAGFPGNSNYSNTDEEEEEEEEDSTAHSTPTHRLSSEPHPPQSHTTAIPPSPLHAQDPRSDESHDLNRSTPLKSCDMHEPQLAESHAHKTHPPPQSHDAADRANKEQLMELDTHHTPTDLSHDTLSELRRRKPDTEAIRAARAISANGGRGEVGGGADSDGGNGGKEFLSTGKSYSQLFSSLQERKAELLEKARR